MSEGFRGVRDFRDLEVWKSCRELRRDVERLCRKFPRQEQARLSDQMIRAARSATANLAEGFGRFHYQETVQSGRSARGSLFELLDHLVVAMDNGYLQPAEFAVLEGRVTSGIKQLNGFIRYLQQRRNGTDTAKRKKRQSTYEHGAQSTDQPVNR